MKREEEAFAVTTTLLCPNPCVRSVFVIERFEKEPNFYNDDILRYG